ncbi:MAG: hypothetical protein OXG11_07755 [Chloroflexi bacterium]|nr:hypothetical protein [Chloroflexota bacterium]
MTQVGWTLSAGIRPSRVSIVAAALAGAERVFRFALPGRGIGPTGLLRKPVGNSAFDRFKQRLFQTVGRRLTCPARGGTDWKALDREIEPPFKPWSGVARPKGISGHARPVLPLVPLVWRKCACVMPFLASEFKGREDSKD